MLKYNAKFVPILLFVYDLNHKMGIDFGVGDVERMVGDDYHA